ncbi:MAG: SDR family oxidoreductase [Polyangiales bacterium]
MSVSAGRVVVTGASRGIGRATADAILQNGGRVVAIATDRSRLERLQAAAPNRVAIVVADLADTAGLGGVVEAAVEPFDGIDGVVNCAGIADHQPVGQITPQAIEHQTRVNVWAPLILGQAFAQHLRDHGGAIVNVSSTLSIRVAPTTTVYAATKAALNSITQSLAQELAAYGIRVNAVLPGGVDTDMLRTANPSEGGVADSEIGTRLESVRALHPLARLGTPAEIADVIVGLLDHPWQTGSLVTIDGGLSIAWG